MMMYVVIGRTGAYEDTHTWIVCVHVDAGQAKEHVKALNALAKLVNVELGRLRNVSRFEWDDAAYERQQRLQEEFENACRELDPDGHVDYFVQYEVYEVPLVRHIDEFKSEAQECARRTVGYYDDVDAGDGTG